MLEGDHEEDTARERAGRLRSVSRDLRRNAQPGRGDGCEAHPGCAGAQARRARPRRRRRLFSVSDPEMVAAGKESYCDRSGMEYRLGARRYTVVDYLELLEEAALEDVVRHEFLGNRWLVEPVPSAAGLLGFPVLVVLEARKR